MCILHKTATEAPALEHSVGTVPLVRFEVFIQDRTVQTLVEDFSATILHLLHKSWLWNVKKEKRLSVNNCSTDKLLLLRIYIHTQSTTYCFTNRTTPNATQICKSSHLFCKFYNISVKEPVPWHSDQATTCSANISHQSTSSHPQHSASDPSEDGSNIHGLPTPSQGTWREFPASGYGLAHGDCCVGI